MISNTLQTKEILYTFENRVATIQLNRPPANSYYKGMLNDLASAIETASQDQDVKVILINSSSEKFFCAGADIKLFSQNSDEENEQMTLSARKVTAAIVSSSKIVVVAVKGHCLGGGLEIALACDIRLGAKKDFLVGLPEAKLGLMPGNGGAPRLIDILGVSRASELLITGNNITGSKAYEYGLFHHAYDVSEFDAKVDEYVASLAKGAGQAMAKVKEYVQNQRGLDLGAALDLELEGFKSLQPTPDAKEGFLAFTEKREPKYL